MDRINTDWVVSAVLEERRRQAERERLVRLAEAGRAHRPRRTAPLGRALIAVGLWLEGNAGRPVPPVVAPALAGSDAGPGD